MKFSFLIPSKNRLELLKHAVNSILQQGEGDIEIVVADNCSTDDYSGWVAGLRDPRILYERSASPVSVTENWNRARRRATGDYVLMLGDDDALAPGYIARMSGLIRKHREPDIIFCAAYHYCYPKVIPDYAGGYLADVRNSVLFKDHKQPYLLPLEEARRVARAIADFRYLFGFNSQHFLFRAGFLRCLSTKDEIRPMPGGRNSRLANDPINYPGVPSIFQSPYPDTYAAAVSFLYAQSVIVVPTPSVIIGISPKSFGFYYFNDLQSEGYKFLDNEEVSAEVRDAVKQHFLPGDRNNTHWLVAIETARLALPSELGLKVNIARYRRLQMTAFLRDVWLKKVRPPAEIASFRDSLTPPERAEFDALTGEIEKASANGPEELTRRFADWDRQLEQFCPAEITNLPVGLHSHVGDAIRWLAHAPPVCPSCGAPLRYRFTCKDKNQRTSGDKYRYQQCGACGITFLQDVPPDLAAVYAKEQYTIPPPDAAAFQSQAETQKWKLEILQSLAAPGSLFEAGPASGEFAFLAKQAGFQPRLAEMDRRCCQFLREVLQLDAVQTADPAAALAGEKSFDAICFWQTIEHIPRFWELMTEAVRHLEPGGVIIVSTPNPISFQAKVLGRFWPHIDTPRHLYLIPQDWFRAFAQKNGLTVVLDTTRDVGSLGLNYYGWYLAVRNALRRRLSERKIQSLARRITKVVKSREETEGRGCSYTIALRKPR